MAEIRFADERDTETILRFIRALAAYEKLSDVCVADAESLRESLFGVRSYAEVLLIEDQNGAHGFALFFHNFSTFLAKPGIYPITGKTSLLQALAMGGGPSELANLQGVVVFRTVDGKKMAAVFDLKQIRAGETVDPQIYGDDIVVVDQSGAKTGLRRILEAIPAFNLFRAY